MDPNGAGPGNLKLSISLGKGSGGTPSVVQNHGFYLLKHDHIDKDEVMPDTNLLRKYGLEKSFHKLQSRRVDDRLSSFLPNIPAFIDVPASEDGASLLKALQTFNPQLRKRICMPTPQMLVGFRLAPGPVPDNIRYFDEDAMRRRYGADGTTKKRDLSDSANSEGKRKRKKHKKDKKKKSKSSSASSITIKKIA